MGEEHNSVPFYFLSGGVLIYFQIKTLLYPPNGYSEQILGELTSLCYKLLQYLLLCGVFIFIFQTLENLLTSVRKGKKIDEDEIPPPVATGRNICSQQASPSEPAPVSQPSKPDESLTLSSHLPAQSTLAAPEQPPAKAPPTSDPPSKLPPPILPKPKMSPAPSPQQSPEAPQEKSVTLAPSPLPG